MRQWQEDNNATTSNPYLNLLSPKFYHAVPSELAVNQAWTLETK